MIKVRAPVLLDSSFNDVRRLEPSVLSLSLVSTPPSTADMTIPFDASDPVPMRAWVRVYDLHGNAEIYRVSASDTLYDTEEQRLTLEHAITSLRDTIIPSPPDPTSDSEIHYSSGNTTRPYTASEMLAFLIVSQAANNCWQAGTCAATDNVFLDRNGDSLFEMLIDMMDQLPDYDLAFDFSTSPWTVSIVAKATTVTAEGRLSRNLGSVRVTYDDSELCTRVWYNAKSGDNYVTTYLNADTQSTYGIAEGSMYLDTDTKLADAYNLAVQYLKKRKEPAIAVEIDAVDLSSATGETIDTFTLGKKFRLTIPAYGLIVDQWITGLSYKDVYGDPEHVTLTLGNRIADISQRSARTTKTAKHAARSASGAGGGGARTGAKKTDELKQDYTYFKQNDYAIEMGAVHDELDDHGELISQQSTKIEQNATHISLIATDEQLTEAASSHQAIFTIQANQISSKVSETDFNGNTIASKINQTSTTIDIEAEHINLTGYVTASQLAALRAEISYLLGDTVTFTNSVWMRGSLSHTGSNLTLLNKVCSWKEQTVVTSVSLGTTSSHDFQKMGGTYVTGKLVTSWSSNNTTIYYIGHS